MNARRDAVILKYQHGDTPSEAEFLLARRAVRASPGGFKKRVVNHE